MPGYVHGYTFYTPLTVESCRTIVYGTKFNTFCFVSRTDLAVLDGHIVSGWFIDLFFAETNQICRPLTRQMNIHGVLCVSFVQVDSNHDHHSIAHTKCTRQGPCVY